MIDVEAVEPETGGEADSIEAKLEDVLALSGEAAARDAVGQRERARERSREGTD